jgi:hypothetical protein
MVGDSYEVVIGTGILDTNGLAYAGSTAWNFTVTTDPDQLQPTVSAFVPGEGSTSIGDNAIVRITFNKNIDPLTLNTQTVTLSSNGNPVPYTFSYDNVSRMTLTPEGALPNSAPITVTVTNGVTDGVGNVVAPSSATFHTAAGPNFTAPHVVSSTITYGDTNVPISSVFTLTFDRPMDTRTFVPNSTVTIEDYFTYTDIPITISFSPDGTQLTVAPNAPLAVGREYYLQTCSALDLTGNTENCYSVYFTTSVVAQTGGPQILATVPRDGTAGLPVNFTPEVQFDRPISEPSAANVTLSGNGSPVALTPSFLNGDTIVRFQPATLLQANTSYVLTITGVTDPAGKPGSTQTVTFNTGAGIDVGYPQVTSENPLSGSTTGTHPTIQLVFNKQIDPIRSNGWFLYNESANTDVVGAALAIAPDLMSATITYPGSLDVNTSYEFGMGSLYDLDGNSGYACCWTFTTGSGPDTSPETVTSVVPANDPGGANPAPLNSIISVSLSKPINPATFNQNSLTLTPSVPGSVSYSGDGLTLTYNLNGLLAPGTQYTLNVSGFTDVDGNAVEPFTSSFVTGSGTYDCCGSVLSITPADGSQNNDPTLPVVVVFDRAVYAPSVNANSIQLYNANDNYNPIGGSISLSSDGVTLTFTPAAPLPPNASIEADVSCYYAVEDLAGNGFPCNIAQFTTGAGSATSPQIVSVMPGDGSTSVGPGAIVTLSFNESLDPNTINSQNFQLFSGFKNLSAYVSRSSDNRMVMLSGNLPYDSNIIVIVNNGVLDLNGNPLASPFRSSFSTISQPQAEFTPMVTGMRPGNGGSGVPINTSITLYVNSPVNPATAQGQVVVSQNGTAVTGTISVKPGGGAIVFTPDVPFANSATIQVFVQPAVTDTNGNPFESYSAQFATVVDYVNTAPQVLSVVPGCCDNEPTNSVVDVQFSKPIDPTTVNTGNFALYNCNGWCGWSNSLVATTISFPSQSVIRLTPTSPLPVSSGFQIVIGTGIADLSANQYGGGTWTFNTGTVFDSTQPSIAAIAPANNATNVGDNATIRFSFNKVMDTVSINPATVTITQGANALPYTESFSTLNGVTYVVLTPLSPLPDNSDLTVSLTNGITDLVGQSLTAQTIVFHTGNGPDLSAPVLVSETIGSSGQNNVPVDSTYSWTFNKPLDPSAYLFVSLYSYSLGQNVATTGSVSMDGRTITLIPTAPLIASTEYQVCYQNVPDIEGNVSASQCNYFYTSGVPDTTPPQVQFTVPAAGSSGAMLNSVIEAVFDKALDPTSLGQVTLSLNGTSVPSAASLAWSDSAVRLTPSALLVANSTYTVTVAGVKDLSGNAIAAPYLFTFTTGGTTGGGGTQLLSTNVLVSGTPIALNGGTPSGVDVNTTIQLVFSAPVDPASLTYGNGITLYNTSFNGTTNDQLVPLSIASISPDQTTVTMTPNGNLAASSSFQLRVGYSSTIYDASGNPIYNGYYYNFATGTASIASGSPLPVYSTGLGSGGVGQLSAGSPDPNWSASNPNGCCLYNGPATVLSPGNSNSSWNPDDANSQWISWADAAGSTPGYSLTQTFDLTGYDPSTAAISGKIWADGAAYLYLNGVQVAYADTYSWSLTGQPGISFSLGPNGALFLPGVNKLTLVVSTSDSWEGVRVLISSATANQTSGRNFQAPRAIYAANRAPAARPGSRSLFNDPLTPLWNFSLIDSPMRSEPFHRTLPLLLDGLPLGRVPLSQVRGQGSHIALARLESASGPPR